MKKRISFILAVVMIMAVMIPAIPVSVSAETKTVNIGTADELKTFFETASNFNNSDIYVELTADIDFNTVYDNNGDYIENWHENVTRKNTSASLRVGDNTPYFQGTFDGNGYTIRGLYTETKGSQWLGSAEGALFAFTTAGAKIVDLTVDGFYVKGNERTGTSVITGGVGGLLGYATKGLTIQRCTLKHGYVGSTNENNLTGGLIGVYMHENTDTIHLNIKDTVVEDSVTVTGNGGAIIGKFGYQAGVNVDLTNSLFKAVNASGVALDPIYTSGLSYVDSCNGKFTVKNDAFLTSKTVDYVTADINNAIKEVKAVGANATRGNFIPTDAQTTIKTAGDFLMFYNTVNVEIDGYNNYVTLEDNVNLAGVSLNGDQNKIFMGTLDGNGHTISNMTIVGNSQTWAYSNGLFGRAQNATIKNLTLDGFSVTGHVAYTTLTWGTDGVGALVGSALASLTVDNVVLKNGTVTSDNVPQNHSVAYGSIIGNYTANGSSHELLITNTTVENTVKITDPATNGGTIRKGGIIGHIHSTNDVSITMDLTGSVINPTGADNAVGYVATAGTITNRKVSVVNTLAPYSENANGTSSNWLSDINAAIAASGAYGANAVAPAQKFYGIQRKTDGTEGLRLIALVKIEDDYTSFDNLGFAVKVGNDSGNVDISKAYTSILADGKPVNAPEGYYFYTYVLTEITDGTVLEFSTYAVKDGVTYTSNVYTYTY